MIEQETGRTILRLTPMALFEFEALAFADAYKRARAEVRTSVMPPRPVRRKGSEADPKDRGASRP